MIPTYISIQFTVNDLSASYYVVGSSDSYSFSHSLGIGSSIVNEVGDVATKVISLEGNYGNFEIKVFAENVLGIRSSYIKQKIYVAPPEFEDTFRFSEIHINKSLEQAKNLDYFIEQNPTKESNLLVANSEFIGKSLEFSWKIFAPKGHRLEGDSVDYELIQDLSFSHFELKLYDDGSLVDFSLFSDQQLFNLSEHFQIDSNDITNFLANYRDFNISFPSLIVEDLGLSRNISLELIGRDNLGRTFSARINGYNRAPDVLNFAQKLNYDTLTFSWSKSDPDFEGLTVRSIAIPDNFNIYNSKDIIDSKNFYDRLSVAPVYDAIVGMRYNLNDIVIYSDGKAYQCTETHVRKASFDDPPNNSKWLLIGDLPEYKYEEFESTSYSFSFTQKWGWKYYYEIQAEDAFDKGQTFNVTQSRLREKGASNSDLFAFSSEIKISEIEYRESDGGFIFNWEVLDQDNNLIDIDQYKRRGSSSSTPSILGLSGSLFDVDTNVFLSGITEGYNSQVDKINNEGLDVTSSSLPTVKNFNSFVYSRELNNNIYKTGGYIGDYYDFNDSQVYQVGENILAGDSIFKCLITNSLGGYVVPPSYKNWSPSLDTSFDNFFVFRGEVFVPKDIKSNPVSVFSLEKTYQNGEVVLFPEQRVTVYQENYNYNRGDLVFFNEAIYQSVDDFYSITTSNPSEQPNSWRRISVEDSLINFVYYQSISQNNFNNLPYAEDRLNWKKTDPSRLSIDSTLFEKVFESYKYNISDWSSSKLYNGGDIVVYSNDIWSGVKHSFNEVPGEQSEFWTNNIEGQNFGEGYFDGDFVFSNGSVYQCQLDSDQESPNGAPISAYSSSPDKINSSFLESNWVPVWENQDQFNDVVFKHIGIPQSGKRSIGIEIGIIDTEGNVINSRRRTAINYPPSITDNGFAYADLKNDKVDSVSEAGKIKFNFNYTYGGMREKTTKVNLYRSSVKDFSILNSKGLPFEDMQENNSTLVKTVIGSADSTFGDNINQIIDTPPIPTVEGVEERTGYFYKILPYDDFGSGVLYEVDDKVLVWPRNYSDRSEFGVPGPVISLTQDEIPGGVSDFGGTGSFTTYFLNWSMPGSQISDNGIIDVPPNDLSHYEVWLSDEQILEDNNQYLAVNDNSGYRRFVGDVKSTIGASENIPPDVIDPGKSITNATNIFNVPANSPSVETSYIGDQGDVGYFWIRTVDKAGNKSKFVGSSNPDANYVEGLKLELGGVQTTDFADFQKNITTEFKNTIALDPPDPFAHNAGNLSWAEHDLWLDGDKYDIAAGSLSYVNSGYVWWDYESNQYSGSNIHPAGSDGFDKLEQFNDGDFIVAKNSNAGYTLAYQVFANALIGTAQISELAVTDAKIQTLTADKITAGQIKGHRIEIFHSGEENLDPGVVEKTKYGSIASVGFSGLKFSNSEQGVLDQNISGFVLSGDGSFSFQQGRGGLSFEEDELTIRGRLRQKNNKDYDFVDIDLSSSVIGYTKTENGLELDQGQADISIDLTFRNSSVTSANDILIKIKDGQNESIVPVGENVSAVNHLDDNWYRLDDLNQEGFEWSGIFNDSNGLKSSSIILSAAKFNEYINENGSEFITIHVSSVHSDLQKKTSITRLVNGKAAESIRLTASSQVFKVDKYGHALSETENIEISVDVQNNAQLISWNSSSGNVKIYDNDNQNTEITGDVAQDKKVIVKAHELIDNNLKSVKITASNNTSSGLISDAITLIVVEDGSNEVNAILSNENHTFTQKDDFTLDNANSGTDIEVFDGARIMSYTSGTPNNGEYTLSATTSNSEHITVGTLTSTDVTRPSYANVNIQDNSLTSASIIFTITGKKFNGETFSSILKKQTFSVSRRALDDVSIVYTNQNHSVPTDKNGTSAVFAGSGGILYVYEGSDLLTEGSNSTSYPTSTSTFNYNLSRVSGDTLTNTSIAKSGDDLTVSFDNNDSITTATVYRITAYIKRKNGTTTSRSVDITLTPVKAGEDGKTAITVELSSTHYAIRYSIDPNDENNLIASPSEYSLTVTPRNVVGENITYTYKKNETEILEQDITSIQAGSLDSYPVTYSVELSVDDSIVAADSITIIALRDGDGGVAKNGRTPTYRGNWEQILEDLENDTDYVKFEQTDTRGDIVEFNTSNDNYWICTKPHYVQRWDQTDDNGIVRRYYRVTENGSYSYEGPYLIFDYYINIPGDQLVSKDESSTVLGLTHQYFLESGDYWNRYWEGFGAEFDNVATDILLTKDVFINNQLILGQADGSSGLIKSSAFTGSFEWLHDAKYTYRGVLDPDDNSYEDNDVVFDPNSSSYQIRRDGDWVNSAAVPAGQSEEEKDAYSTSGFAIGRGGENIFFDIGGKREVDGDSYSFLRYNPAIGKIEIRGAFINNTSLEQVTAILNDDGTATFSEEVKDTLATFVAGGYQNKIESPTSTNSYRSLASSILGGGENEIVGRFSFIGNGYKNICKDNFSSIIGGHSNEMPREDSTNQGCNAIIGGQKNSIDGGSNQIILGGENNQIVYTL